MSHDTGQASLTFEVGSDVGGTFTDLWVRASDGRTKVFKSPTTADIVGGVVGAVRLAAGAFEVDLPTFCAGIRRFGHGTTVGLNALLTRRTGRTSVITTEGFADTIEIGRMKRQYSGLNETEVSDYLRRDAIPPIVGRRAVVEVPERIDRTGTVIAPLDEDAARATVAQLMRDDVEAVAICTLWSTENPSHEERLRELVAEAAPDVAISVSHEVSPAVGEYARMSTTAANAALKPVMSDYLRRLARELEELGVTVPVLMTTGTGGVVPASYLADLPVAALLSGPAAGVIACQELGRRMGRTRLLTTDIGGTSFDVGLVVDGAPLMASSFGFGGVDVRVPCIDVRSIGAGGGSIASVNFGELTAGPQSAGANPGPACYGRGGTMPTGTDADLVLGVLDPAGFAGGDMPLDREAAERAIAEQVAEPLDLSVVEAAWGIRQVLDSRMADLLRRVTIERGHDPRTFTMFANGGAGPSHGWVLARELAMDEFVVPATATVQSALGAGTSAVKISAERTVHVRLPPDGVATEAQLEELAGALRGATEEAVAAPLGATAAGDAEVEAAAAVRFRGQSQHLDISITADDLQTDGFAAFIGRFEREYESLFGKGAGFRLAGYEVLSVRALATRSLPTAATELVGDQLVHVGARDVWFDDPHHPEATDVYTVEHPADAQTVEGPCLIEFSGQTVVVPPGSTATSDAFGNLIVRTA